MPSRRSCLLVAVTTFLPFLLLPVVVEGRGDNWYATICSTGPAHSVTFDENSDIPFGSGDSMVDPGSNFTYNVNESMGENSAKSNGARGRWLRRLEGNRDVAESASLPEGTTSALPWMRQTQQQQDDGRTLYDYDYPFNMTILPESQRNSSDSQQLPQMVRPCLCHPKYLFSDFYGPNETIPDLYLCPVSAGFCGIPLPGNGPVQCFDISVQEMIAVNAWPIVFLWYLGMLLICCITIHGTTAIDFCLSFCDPQRNKRHVDRIVAAQTAPFRPPSRWNMWAWQNYRFEQSLLAQARVVLRSRDELRQEQGLSPMSFEMKTKRYSKEDHCAAEDYADDDSTHEPACTICFVPLEDGDIVGDLSCQHIFHKACLKSWFRRKNACPLCNTMLATRRPDPQPQDIAAPNNA